MIYLGMIRILINNILMIGSRQITLLSGIRCTEKVNQMIRPGCTNKNTVLMNYISKSIEY